jgi:hypothetical protein
MLCRALALAALALTGCADLLGIDDLTGPTDPGPDAGITGTSQITWARVDGTSPKAAEDLTGYTIRAYIPDATAPGGFRIAVGQGKADGTFAIGDAPAAIDGAYLLELTRPGAPRALFAVARRDLDAGYVTVGRPDAVRATATTPVSLHLTGMTAWGQGDALRMTSYGAGTDLDAAARYTDPPILGATALTSTSVDWFAGVVPDPGTAPPRLVGAGDDLWVAHLATVSTTTDQGDAAALTTPIDLYSTHDAAMTDGATATVTGAFAPIAADQTLAFSADLTAWLAGKIATEFSPAVTCTGLLEPGAPFGVADGFGAWTLGTSQSPTGTRLGVAAIHYPAPMPGAPGMVHCEFQFARTVRVPGLGPAQFAIRSVVDAPLGARVDLKPSLPPPRGATLAGITLDVGGDFALDGNPVAVRWPPVADATQYQIAVRRLTAQAGQSVVQRVATIDTASAGVDLPADLFAVDTTYVINVTAVRATGGMPIGQLRRTGAFAERATTLSEAIAVHN